MSLNTSTPEIIEPNWPAPKNIRAYSTTRMGGVSEGGYSHFNLAQHVGDNIEHVEKNRQQLIDHLKLPSQPVWLNQIHGIQVSDAAIDAVEIPEADASYSFELNKVCSVMTADCLPVLICNRNGTKVAAVHAGWRGLANGVIEASIAALNEKASELMVWLGPAIGPKHFEVGEEVRQIFVNDLSKTSQAFVPHKAEHYLADIYQLARMRLNRLGIDAIYGGEFCTYTDAEHFYSYRRDGKTGRQASLIWIE